LGFATAGNKTWTDHDAPVLVEVVKSRIFTPACLSVPSDFSDLLAINQFGWCLVLVVILVLDVEDGNFPRSQSSEGERRCYLPVVLVVSLILKCEKYSIKYVNPCFTLSISRMNSHYPERHI
jgi:hypothetical protein